MSASPNGKEGQFDIKLLKEYQEYGTELAGRHAQSKLVMEAMSDLYHLDWDEVRSVTDKFGDNAKITLDPTPRNTLIGAIRLMTATEPQFSVPFEKNDAKAKATSGKLEKFAAKMWHANSREQGDPVHYDVVRSALLWADVAIRIHSTKDLVAFSKGAQIGAERHFNKLHERTPYIFSVLNPIKGYPDYGKFGLTAYYSREKLTRYNVENEWGTMAKAVFDSQSSGASLGRFGEVTLHEFWDFEYHMVWLEGFKRPLLQDKHGLDFIPIEGQITEGSRLFTDEEDQREPFLYTLYKSGLWKRLNLSLSVMFQNIFDVGASPQFNQFLLDPSQGPVTDHSIRGGVQRFRVGETEQPRFKNVVDPAIQQGIDRADQLTAESTIYPQALGEPLGANAPYSMVALLAQTGRLPLNTHQRKAGWAIGGAMEKALLWMKKNGESGTATYQGSTMTLDPKDIPDHLDFEAILDIKLPQDKLTQANIAVQITQGQQPLASKRWARENVLQIGQSDEMQEEIWGEQTAELLHEKFTLEQLMTIEQLRQQALQPQAAAGIPGGPPPIPTPQGPLAPAQPGTPEVLAPPEMGPPVPPAPPIQPFTAPGTNIPGGLGPS